MSVQCMLAFASHQTHLQDASPNKLVGALHETGQSRHCLVAHLVSPTSPAQPFKVRFGLFCTVDLALYHILPNAKQ